MTTSSLLSTLTRTLAGALFVLSVCAVPVHGQEAPGTIEGVVQTADGEPAPAGVNVSLDGTALGTATCLTVDDTPSATESTGGRNGDTRSIPQPDAIDAGSEREPVQPPRV
jgi:hypothetical protein